MTSLEDLKDWEELIDKLIQENPAKNFPLAEKGFLPGEVYNLYSPSRPKGFFSFYWFSRGFDLKKYDGKLDDNPNRECWEMGRRFAEKYGRNS